MFSQVPYYKQLVVKEQECKKILKELGNRLSKAGVPLQRNFKKLPCVLEPTRPSVGVTVTDMNLSLINYCDIWS